MTKYGLQQAEPEVYGIITDMTEQLMRELVSSLIQQSRLRRQDADPKMILAKPGDTARVRTVLYVDESSEPQFEQYGPGSYLNRQPLFAPKETEPFDFVCTTNVGKDINNLLGSEYDNMKDRQDN
jgi:hypothetical protein